METCSKCGMEVEDLEAHMNEMHGNDPMEDDDASEDESDM